MATIMNMRYQSIAFDTRGHVIDPCPARRDDADPSDRLTAIYLSKGVLALIVEQPPAADPAPEPQVAKAYAAKTTTTKTTTTEGDK